MRDTNATHGHGHEQAQSHERDRAASAPVTSAYGVEGMTCSHCIASVTEELSQLDGVTGVDVDLVAGGVSRVTVASDTALSDDQVAAAIDEAGYALVDLPR